MEMLLPKFPTDVHLPQFIELATHWKN